MADVFVSYRREDTRWASLLLAEALRRRLGPGRVFHDVGDIAGGSDFTARITAEVTSCHVLVALMGSIWATVTDGSGRPRVHDPGDLVVREIAEGLSRGKKVLPVLVDTDVMPPAKVLPEALGGLVGRQAEYLVHRSGRADAERIAELVEKLIPVPTVDHHMTKAGAPPTGEPRVDQQMSAQRPPRPTSPRRRPRRPPSDPEPT